MSERRTKADLARDWVANEYDGSEAADLLRDVLREAEGLRDEVKRLKAENESLRPKPPSVTWQRLEAWMHNGPSRRVETWQRLDNSYYVDLQVGENTLVVEIVYAKSGESLTRADADRCINAALDKWEQKYGRIKECP